jgi:hypothetical protein
MGGDFYDVFGGVRVGGFEVRDHGFVEGFSCPVKDFSEASLARGEGMAELQQGFGYGARGGAGEADDADPAAAGRGGDGHDGVVEFGHFLMVICRYFFGRFSVAEAAVLQGDCDFLRCFWVVSLVIACIFVVETWWLDARFRAANFFLFLEIYFYWASVRSSAFAFL